MFKETDWDVDVPDNKEIFHHKQRKVKPKKKKKPKQPAAVDDGESVGGLYVRIHTQHDNDDDQSKKASERPGKKRKSSEVSVGGNQPKKKFIPSPVVADKPAKPESKSIGSGSTFGNQLRDNLKGSRFRFLNEELYRKEGKESFKMFKNDPEAFNAYHEGYRSQVEQWPLNPLKRIINSISKIPKSQVIADFGCGEGFLAKSVPHKVYSLDLVAANPDIIACDMSRTPLKTGSVNIVVFCLSLMGTNLRDFILEANRVMQVDGKLKIAEVSSRFGDVDEFVRNIEKCGFKLQNKDENANLFYFMQFKKVKNVTNGDKTIQNFSLKPCLYKKR